MNVLHGLTGSVASVLKDKIRREYIEQNIKVSFMETDSADHFTNSKAGATITYNTEWEWHLYHKDKIVLHIELVKKYDALVIAPLSANTLAKIANGICDNLVTCVARAWDFNKPFIIAPAMNDMMYSHPITEQHLNILKSWGITIIPPQTKKLFCGTYGLGAMANVEDIINLIK